MSVDCFVVGIVKGLVERNSATHHFGSTLSFGYHFENAVSLGLVEEVDGVRAVTGKGLMFYQENNLSTLPDTRSYLWHEFDWRIDHE